MSALVFLLLLLTCLATRTTSKSLQNPRTGFDLLDANLRSLIFRQLSQQDLYQMHKAPELKAHVEEFSAGFQRHDDIVKKCKKWWNIMPRRKILDKLYGVHHSTSDIENAADSSGRYGKFMLSSLSDDCLDALSGFCTDHRSSRGVIEVHPLNIVVSFSSEFQRLQRISSACGVHLMIENGEHLLASRFLNSLILELARPGNRIYELTVKNPRHYDIDWMMYREVSYNIVPPLNQLASHISNEPNIVIKSLNILELDNRIQNSAMLVDTIRLALNGTSVESFKLLKAHVGFDHEISRIFAESIKLGNLRELSVSNVQGMTYSSDFWKSAARYLKSLEITQDESLRWTDLLAFSHFIRELNSASSLETLILKRIKCRFECHAALIEILSSKNVNLKSLELSFLSLSDDQIHDIFDELLKQLTNTSEVGVKHFNLMGNTITSLRTFKKLLKLIEHPRNRLERLSIYIHLEKYEDIDLLIDLLESPNCKLKNLKVILDNYFIFKHQVRKFQDIAREREIQLVLA